jgi:hypothetical protein
MKNLLDVLSADERAYVDRSLDPASAPTERARQKTEAVRRVLEQKCLLEDAAEEKWAGAEPRIRQKVLAELIWRVNCVVEGSQTAVMGLDSWTMGHGFKLTHKRLETGAAFILF